MQRKLSVSNLFSPQRPVNKTDNGPIYYPQSTVTKIHYAGGRPTVKQLVSKTVMTIKNNNYYKCDISDRWQDYVTNDEVLRRNGLLPVSSIVRKRRLVWTVRTRCETC